MHRFERLAFLASAVAVAQEARERLVARYGDHPLATAQAIVALGGDGFMLQTLHATTGLGLPVYGMNRGT
ncbi:MAG: NAD(+)/NADH kinase, partial [Rhodobacteraceae bacterium]|nr:NAD(+)/NADH kinase [Paracoccaceae bacterium]